MVIRNSLHLLDQIADLEEKIKKAEKTMAKTHPEVDLQALLKWAFEEVSKKRLNPQN